jgi:MraZ protein
MFRGVYEATIDAKGRVILPVKLREALVDAFGDDRFFLTNSNPVRIDAGGSLSGLAIYPYSNWLKLEEDLEDGTRLGLSSSGLAAVRRRIIAPAIECATDKLGRILIPPHLRRNAALERDIVCVGLQSKAEIWSTAVWEKVQEQDDLNFPDTPVLAGIGL